MLFFDRPNCHIFVEARKSGWFARAAFAAAKFVAVAMVAPRPLGLEPGGESVTETPSPLDILLDQMRSNTTPLPAGTERSLHFLEMTLFLFQKYLRTYMCSAVK